MLVLSRKVGQRVLIGKHIRVTIVRSRGRLVKLGIEAPRRMRVRREEVGPRPAEGTPAAEGEPAGADQLRSC